MARPLGRIFAAAMVILGVSMFLRLETSAQIRPVYDQGALGLAQLLRRLDTSASALMIGAHPDDEDTALLAYLARGENARTAYLSLTRGDGGQNIIGPELGEALGVIRTEELLQARKLDGAEQYFTRAYDYGFSKTLAEAKSKWDETVIMCDVVRVIRSYQPLVVISQFTGTPIDGHGQHQFAGYITPLAVRAAADASQCTDAGKPWTVTKLYIRHRGQGEPTVRINTGNYDSLLGRSYFEIAMQARSQHRSQEQGVLELKGDQYSNLLLAGDVPAGSNKAAGIFDGINTSALSYLGAAPNFSAGRTCFAESISTARREYDLDRPEVILPYLIRAYGCLDAIDVVSEKFDQRQRLEAEMETVKKAIELAAGIQIDALAESETITHDEDVSIALNVYSRARQGVAVKDQRLDLPPSWSQSSWSEPSRTEQPLGFRREVPFFARVTRVHSPKSEMEQQPYWLINRRKADQYDWIAGSGVSALEDVMRFQPWTRPFGPPLIRAHVTVEILGKNIQFSRDLEYRYADDVRGEIRRPFTTLPKVALGLSQELLVVPKGPRAIPDRELNVTVTNNSKRAVSGEVQLTLPPGWKSRSERPTFVLKAKSENAVAKFWISVPPNAPPGSYRIQAEAIVDGERFSRSVQSLSYEHIQLRRIYRPASVDVRLVDVRTAPVRVGYIRGSGDRVADALRQLGIAVEDLDENTLGSAALDKLDTIVIGIRAYQVRPDVVAHNQRLLDFVSGGGTLIVQYQLPATFSQQDLTPYPTQMGPRVADENAPVTILQPDHPIFNFPNKITQEDFKGWVQERNLYNFSTLDPKFTGLLESHDAGEPENKGGLVIAEIGKGKYVYCSYSLFRQLPAGVPGAYRLLANLVSLPKASRTTIKK